MKSIFIAAMGLLLSTGVAAQNVIHISPDGDDSAAGTAAAPWATLEKAVEAVEPGGTIYVHGGVYYPAKRVKVPGKATSADARIKLWAWGDGEAIIDGSKMTPTSVNEFKGSRCMYFPYDANYWHVKGLIFQNAFDNGVKVEGSYNIFERCIFRGNNDTGLQIGMFKDWSIEECKGFPIKGTPEFNPGYTYCRGNKVINCDAYNNYDATVFGGGADDGGDADGFACKLFPGPGTEFYGCRAWNNSDDNWDLYMVYHPIVIDHCWAWKAAVDKNGSQTPGNGNGFKLGGGGSSGGAAFSQSTGAHVVTNCVSFSNTKKGFDQNNAYEGMYLFNNVAWDNDYNYRFPTVFQYGSMYIRNCVGFAPRTLNHEFLSATKEGSVVPNTDYNSWTTIDGCDPYKDGNKVNKVKVYAADHSADFVSLLESDAKAERLADGSLPENNFVRLTAGSKFIDAGQIISDFTPARFMTEAQASAAGIELTTVGNVTIDYNDASADMGAVESGIPTRATLTLTAGELEQTVYTGTAIEPVTLKWGGAATDVTVEGAEGLEVSKDAETRTVTISGTAVEKKTVTVTTVGGEAPVSITVTVNVSTIAPGTLECTTGNQQQVVFIGSKIEPMTFTAGGGATAIKVEGLPEGLTATTEGLSMTIEGTPETAGEFTVTATGGMTDVSMRGSIVLETPSRVLTGDWYHFDEPFESIHSDLRDVMAMEQGSSYVTVWDHEYTEGGTVPAGCTAGAVNVERDGALVWNLPSLLELKANIHFTGGRTLTISWQIEGEAEHTWTSTKMSKRTLTGWDLMQQAGIPSTDKPITVKFKNIGNNGGIRVYDFYAKVHANGTNGVAAPVATAAEELSYYVTDGAIVLGNENVAAARLYDASGRVVSQSIKSQILALNGYRGVAIVQVITTDGRSIVAKVRL